jgi:oligopeptide/dipeptide ABC transporter ATP-binding protein
MRLSAEALRVTLGPADGSAPQTTILDAISFDLIEGRTLGVVGESGCGKSMTALALMGLVPTPGRIEGRLMLGETDLLTLPDEQRRRLRGKRMGMIFQEPMTALNPVMPVGSQIAEMLEVHEGASTHHARSQAVRLLEQVGIAAAAERAHAFPHQLSGGMRQRVMIAIAIACRPQILIADEPTTALDVSVQAQIMDLLLDLQRQEGMAIMFISHNLGVISEMSDEVMVMYAGRVVEQGNAEDIVSAPRHPYTQGLLATIPDMRQRKPRLPVIPGNVPDPRHLFAGCRFAPRCAKADAACATVPALLPTQPGGTHHAACVHA